MEQREFIVEAEAAGQRIDRFLSGEDTGLSRSALQGLVADGHVLCNGKASPRALNSRRGTPSCWKFLTQSLSRLCRRTSRWTSCTRTTTFWW